MTANLIWVLLFIGALIFLSMIRASKKKSILFFGDSITAAGMQYQGYILQIDALIKEQASDLQYQLIGAGISGNKIYDLYLRLEEDVLTKSPNIVVIYIGINDVWHKQDYGTGTDEDRFEKFYRAIIKKLLYNGCKVVLCTPTVIGERKGFENPLDEDLNKYATIVRQLANEYALLLVDLRQVFLMYNEEYNVNDELKGILTTDGVHLNATGNALVANALWQVIKTIK